MKNTALSNPRNGLIQKSVYLFVMYTILTMAVYILPYTKLMLPYIGVATLMLVSLPLFMMKKSDWFRYGIVLISVTTLLMFVYLINGSSYVGAINDAIRNIRFFLPVLWGCFAIEYCTPKQQKMMLIAFVAVTGLVLYKTLLALEVEPWIVRILAEDQSYSTPEINAFRLDNVGGYAFAYMMGIVTICVTDLVFSLKKKWQKVIAVIGVVFCFYFIIKSMYTTLLILSSMCVLLVLLFRVKSLPAKVTVVIGFIVLAICIVPLVEFLSQAFGGSLLSKKFGQIHTALTGGGTESLGLRPQLLKQALLNWMKTPLLGSNYDTPSHSLIFEILQQNGIVGLFFWLYMFFASCNIINRKMKAHNIDPVSFKLCCVYLFVLSIFNDTRYVFEITLALFFMVPIYADFLGNVNNSCARGK